MSYMRSLVATPYSRKNLRDLAYSIRSATGTENQLCFPIWIRYELTLPKTQPMICGKYTKKYGILF